MVRIAAFAAALVLVRADAWAAPAPPAPSKPAASKLPALPEPSLGVHASLVEGTWEFRSMTRPDGLKLTPPEATGLLVIDRGVVLAASYIQPTPQRQVGSVWEGRLVLGADRFDVIPEKGWRYDSTAKDRAMPVIPPRTTGKLEVLEGGAIRLTREDGGTVTFEPGGRRVQHDADGTVIVHERTSLVPKIPENLPGRGK